MLDFSFFLVLFVALVLDACCGELKRFHPLVGFGHYAQTIERFLNVGENSLQARGMIAWSLAVLVPTVVLVVGSQMLLGSWLYQAFSAVIVYLAIGWRSLHEHALRVARSDEISEQRQAVSMMVSRDVDELCERDVHSATIESTIENTLDAVIGVMFWYAIAGLPGVIVYRLSNTLDAMWGYQTTQYQFFGRASAKIDDALNWIPARLLAFTFTCLSARPRDTWQAWQQQAPLLESPNGGPVMVSGAHYLGLRLGGPTVYHGQLKEKPFFSGQRDPEADDIFRSLRLVNHVVIIWTAAIGIMVWIL